MSANQTFTPSDFIVPIMGINEDGSCGPFLGTGTFVAEPATLVTCDHVLEQWDDNFGIVVEEEHELFFADVLSRNPSRDLALLRVRQFAPPHVVPLEENPEIILNKIVMCFEYGTTITAGTNIHFSPANRMGNVTRFRNLIDRYDQAGDHMLELSFPALKGASGAPVMDSLPPFSLWGIVTANIGYELIPAQIERYVDEGGELSEEMKFYLPQALAIHAKHVRWMLEGFG